MRLTVRTFKHFLDCVGHSMTSFGCGILPPEARFVFKEYFSIFNNFDGPVVQYLFEKHFGLRDLDFVARFPSFAIVIFSDFPMFRIVTKVAFWQHSEDFCSYQI